jgi:hypothetical protein
VLQLLGYQLILLFARCLQLILLLRQLQRLRLLVVQHPQLDQNHLGLHLKLPQLERLLIAIAPHVSVLLFVDFRSPQ